MGIVVSHFDKGFRSRLLLPTLLLGMFLVTSGLGFFSTLLPNIASSFKVSIGTVSTLGLVVNSIGLIMGLAMGALTIRFNHKLLLLSGVAMYMAGMLGLFLAPNFATAMLVNFFTGTGRAMVLIMVLSLIGELLPLEKRGWAVGLTVSAVMFAFVSVPLLSASIAEVAGWRSVLLWFILPVSIACFSLALFTVPSKPSLEQSPAKLLYSEAFKKIFFNKSAIVCLVGTTLLTLVGVVPVYAVSFYRIDFSVSTMTGGMFASVAAAGGILGGVGSGRLINRFGRKPLTFVAALVSAAFAILFTFMPQMWISVAFWVVSATATAMASAALRSLILEQVPMFRGSMMSVNQSFEYVGTILIVALGGLILNLYSNNFQLLMTIFGSFGIAGGLIVFLLATDPCKPT